jgi:hypothetical protein
VSAWRHRDDFPPRPERPNLLPTLFETSLLIAATGMLNFALFSVLLDSLRFLAIPAISLCVGTFVAVAYRETIKTRVASTSPEECWADTVPRDDPES